MSNGCVRQLKLSSRESRKLLIKSEADTRHCGWQYVCAVNGGIVAITDAFYGGNFFFEIATYVKFFLFEVKLGA